MTDSFTYFAYGSNLDQEQMQRRCPDSEYLGIARLAGYRLVFDGYSSGWDGAVANIVPDQEAEVWGALYKVTDPDIQRLDRYEGYPSFYQREDFDLESAQGEPIAAFAYLREAQEVGEPSGAYWDTVTEGAFSYGIRRDYIDRYIVAIGLDITRRRIQAFAVKIENGDYPHDNREWGGADVAINAVKRDRAGDRGYGEPRAVITPFARELSWLFERMRDTFRPFIDSCSKIEFFGRMANAALCYQAGLNGAEEDEKALLGAVVREASLILDEMERGCFKCLAVAIGNTIYDDFKEQDDNES